MRCIGVTGAGGFVGSALCKTFAERGWKVVGLGRRPVAGYDFRQFDLAQAPSPSLLEGIDVLVHAAYDARPAATNNLEGTRKLFSAAGRAGVRQIVFISSMAASADAASRYGREKYAAELLLVPSRDLAVRPGLVIGDGGLFKSMYRLATRLRVAPIFAGGTQPVYVVGIGELSCAVAGLVERGAHGIVPIAGEPPVRMSELYGAIERKAGKRIVLLPLPLDATLAVVTLLERCGIRPPIDSERLRGLKNMRRLSTPPGIPGVEAAPSLAAMLSALEIS